MFYLVFLEKAKILKTNKDFLQYEWYPMCTVYSLFNFFKSMLTNFQLRLRNPDCCGQTKKKKNFFQDMYINPISSYFC